MSFIYDDDEEKDRISKHEAVLNANRNFTWAQPCTAVKTYFFIMQMNIDRNKC